MPAWLLVALMSVAVYRLTRLVVKDDFPPVLWLRDRLSGGWRQLTVKEIMVYNEYRRGPIELRKPSPPEWVGDVILDEESGTPVQRYVHRAGWVPQWLADLLSCPWCASGWVSLAVTAVVAATVGVPAPLLVWLAVWGAGALLAAREWS